MRLVRAVRRRFEGSASFLDDPRHREFVGEYLADLVRPRGLALDAGLSGHSYGEMAEALLRASVTEDEPVDMLVVAFANHDVYPGRALATYLSSLCPGTPLSFAVCDQGPAAAFTALRIFHAAKPARALLLVLEQSALPYPSDAPLPEQHRGVALLLDAAEPPSRVRQHAGVDAADVPQLLALGPEPGTPLLIGEALAAAWPGHPPHTAVAPPRQPMTGVWWLAADPAVRQGRIVVADYDPALRYLSCAELLSDET